MDISTDETYGPTGESRPSFTTGLPTSMSTFFLCSPKWPPRLSLGAKFPLAASGPRRCPRYLFQYSFGNKFTTPLLHRAPTLTIFGRQISIFSSLNRPCWEIIIVILPRGQLYVLLKSFWGGKFDTFKTFLFLENSEYLGLKIVLHFPTFYDFSQLNF